MAVKNLRTRAFEIARCRGIKTDAELARVMEISHATVSRVQSQLRQINQVFILGALRAFPDLTFEELFFIDPARAVALVEQAERERAVESVYPPEPLPFTAPERRPSPTAPGVESVYPPECDAAEATR